MYNNMHTSLPYPHYQNKISWGLVQHEPIEKHKVNQILQNVCPINVSNKIMYKY